jgi:4-aminobutyrate aminotransferase/(S)-3-amino-2-methylpropionate transaminase
VPFPACRFPLAEHAEENAKVAAASLAALERVLDANAGRVAAVIVEPIQSEGGDRHAPAGFFRSLAALVRKSGAALVLDEVQTGVGITGTLWANEQLDLEAPPDLVAFGKKMQLGGFFANERFTIGRFGRMYQTRNGDRARAILARAVLSTIVDGGLLPKIRETGRTLLGGLEELARRYPRLVSDPRGLGLLCAFDFPTPAVRDDFLKRALRRGVMATYTGTRSVRLRPHLVCGAAEVERALGAFDAVLGELSG